jgi:hypothetical protein
MPPGTPALSTTAKNMIVKAAVCTLRVYPKKFEKSVKITASSSILDSVHNSILDSVLATNMASLNNAAVNLDTEERRDTGFSRCWILS